MNKQKKLKNTTAKETKEKEKEINILIKTIKDLRQDAKKLQVDEDQTNHELSKQRAELDKLLRDARLEEVEIPMVRKDTESESDSEPASMSVGVTPSQDHFSQSTSKVVRKNQQVLSRVDLSQLKNRKLYKDPEKYEKKKAELFGRDKKNQCHFARYAT